MTAIIEADPIDCRRRAVQLLACSVDEDGVGVYSVPQIAERIGAGLSTVGSDLQRLREEGVPLPLRRRDRSGRVLPTRKRRRSDAITWPIAPLLDRASDTLPRLADRAGFTERTGYRWARAGRLTDQEADALAIAAGLHPCLVWPDWFSVVRDEDDLAS